VSKPRTRSVAYRQRRKVRAAARRNRASEARDYWTMLERTPGFDEKLERDCEFDRMEEMLIEEFA
jgi:hypothetical protein